MRKSDEQKIAERIASNLAHRLLRLREDMVINEPTIIRKVGDRVQRGNITKSIIKEILADGKIYLLVETCTDHNYGHPVEYSNQDYVLWNQVETYFTKEEIQSMRRLHTPDDVRFTLSNTSVEGVLSMYYAKTNMNPPYQRGDVWGLSDKVSLIDSIFKNIDIGKLTFIQLEYSAKGPVYEILDGKQRLQTLVDFIEGRFDYMGVKYRDMHPGDRNHFDSFNVSFSSARGMTLDQKYKYFLKLNTKGKSQTTGHLNYVRDLITRTKGEGDL
jgi:hypothetical protein